ncbi:hypothetical protein BCR36DRAFT_407160 [Piromyces finnis]|uniref:Clathrin light chain n=1 Tax=Piromyces finnis TaxID=1754191 RepID=A0A1Y1UVQ6_9FUNG|nr:hypothetical protein BCR36DRAFT_407160 [Piromyces finnis]|eukprot:ORX42145.1 hypothetical protein BCR36DRAFT_407160 [Piromyces finnis]
MADDFGAFESDPTADFLAREQAMLGDDAEMFNTGNIDIPLSMPQPIGGDASAVPLGDADFGNFEAVTPAQSVPVANPLLDMMSSVQDTPVAAVPAAQTPLSAFPQTPINIQQTIQTPINTSFSQTISQVNVPAIEENTSNDSGLVEKVITEVDVQNSPFVKEANEKREKIIEERDARNATKHNDIIASAKSDIEKFYADYNQKKNKAIENNRLYQGNNIPQSNNPNELTWDIVCKNINFNSLKTKNDNEKNLDRFKDLLLDLSKSNEYIKTN